MNFDLTSPVDRALALEQEKEILRIRRDAKKAIEAEEREAHGRIVEGAGLPEDDLCDASDVAAEGRQIEADGIPQLVHGLIPCLGMLGFLVAYAKVGKTTFGLALAAAVAMAREFLGHATQSARVLVLCAEDPPEYTAWVARHLDVERGRMTFYRRPILLTPAGLAQITATVKQGGYGLVLISSWQAVIRGLVKEENDNAGAVNVVEDVKAAARATGVPWLIDAHSGKGEDQDDDADPSKAMRGASAAAGAADFTLSLRYANGAFGTQRRLSGKGRFVSFEPLLMEFDPQTSNYTVIASTKDAMTETTWHLIVQTGALTEFPLTEVQIAVNCGLAASAEDVTTTHRRKVRAALKGRAEVGIVQDELRGQKRTRYRRIGGGQ